jgi:hypothetical protein
MVTRNLVELVAMQEQKAPAIGQLMYVLANQFNVTEGDPEIVAQRLVVIARNENYALATSRPLQNLLHNGVLGGSPDDAPAHGPEIDNVTDEENVLGHVAAQELQQAIGLTGSRSQMDVGKKN